MSAKILKQSAVAELRALLGARAMLTAIACAFAITLSTAAGAAAITVNTISDESTSSDGLCSLREAINNANAKSDTTSGDCAAGTGNDTIVFSVVGTILLTDTLPQIGSVNDVLVSNILTINGPAAPGITIDGQNAVQIMLVAPGATLNLNNLKVANGSAGEGNSGGGIFSDGTLTVTNTTFSGNSAGASGGAVASSDGTLTVINTTFSGNSAGTRGGAIDSSFGTLTVINSTFSGNAGNSGGAIDNFGGTLTVTNSTLSGNSASSLGGGISNISSEFNATLTVTNSTFSANAAKSGGAVSNSNGGASSFKNAILAASSQGGNCSGTIADAGYNISDDNSCGFSASGSQNSTDPKLDPVGLSNNGGSTQTIALLAGSPAIDVIPFAACTDQRGAQLTTDQRGFARPDAGENVCDTGAYEFQHPQAATIVVNSLADPSVAGRCTLRDAITAADTMTAINGCPAGGDFNTIQFSVTGTIPLTNPLPPVTNSLTINGPASPGITIDGGNKVQIMQVASGATLNFSNLTIAHGFATNGGGILSVGALTVSNSTFSGNRASEGGAIFDSGTLTVTNSTFAGNSASEGGGIFNSGTLIVSNSTFSGNSGEGGGIFNTGSASLKNSITAVSSSSVSSLTLNCSGPIADAGYNISDDNSCGFSASGSLNGTNPKLDPAGLSNNGGPTQTIALVSGSPAIDAIPLASCTDQRGAQLTTDQRGVVRPDAPEPDAPENVCDVGAYEFQEPPPQQKPPVGAVIQPPTPTATTTGPGGTASSGTFKVQNTSGTTLVTPMVKISFGNADLFSSATLTATVGSNISTATVNPVTRGNSPEQSNNTPFFLQPPLVIPTGQTATFSLAVTVTANPQITKRVGPVMYAAMMGYGSTGSNAFLIALALLELCAAGLGTTRRRRVLVAVLLLLAMANQVGCNNSSGGGAGTASGVVHSMQAAMQVDALNQNKEPVKVAGLPVVIGTVSVGVK
jgi:CSLREA domain-containing protein